jgi:hypothetical protein
MAIDFQQITLRIREIGKNAQEIEKTTDRRREKARTLLNQFSDELEFLGAKVDSARAADPNIRCARPLNESLNSHYPLPVSISEATLIAADGSQINPDRHASLLYSLINIGLVVFKPGSNLAPEVFSYADMKYGDELYTDTGNLLTEDLVALGRDLSERRKLLDLAMNYTGQVITFTDGPIELWGAKGSSEVDFRRNRDIHLDILSKMASKNILTAGFIEKPAADLVARLLEIAQVPENEMKDIRTKHSLRGVTDRWLFNLLKKGERSAIFVMQSSSRNHYTNDLEIHFFYLNVGDEKHPWVTRVEIPYWVAKDKNKVELVHATLLHQCEIMGARPYPYILHRAHESAVVKQEEKLQVEQMLTQELRTQNVEVGEGSYKQSAKDLNGRTRM